MLLLSLTLESVAASSIQRDAIVIIEALVSANAVCHVEVDVKCARRVK